MLVEFNKTNVIFILYYYYYRLSYFH